ncbi:hypothetical protein RN001_005378, partial [Aquatica leii]
MDRFLVDVDYCEEAEEGVRRRKKRRVKRKKTTTTEFTSINILADIADVKLLVFSLEAQATLECSVGTDVTTQNPWKYVSKKLLAENLEVQDKMSNIDFMSTKTLIESYPSSEILLCYKTDDEVDFDQFFVCLTPKAETMATEIMDTIKREMDSVLGGALSKTIRPWKARGSEDEVNLQLIKNNRPLLELEVETEYPIITAKCHFKLKTAEEFRDGYVSILPGRAVYENVTKRRVDACSQITPLVISDSVQTASTFPHNIWTQYKYEYNPVTKFTRDFCKNISEFIRNRLDYIDDTVYTNGFFNFYTTDYTDLIKNVEHQFYVKFKELKEIFSFVDYSACKGKTITNVSWHYMWTGTVAAAYSNKAFTSYCKGKSNIDEVTEAIFNVSPVLLWCFNDNLNPKLYLQSPREINALSFCPYNENILVGGCVNGQIVIWDITDKISRVEKQEILTTRQQNYRTLMNSLINWMKNTRNVRVVRSVVVSNLAHSHRSHVTAIKWISPYREITRSGQIKDIPENEHRSSLQFLTSSTDGTVLAWDLNVVPTDKERAAAGVPKKRRSRLKSRPEGLVSDVSPLQPLNRIFKPIFKVNFVVPGTTRSLPLTNVNILVAPPVQYRAKSEIFETKFDITKRCHYEPIFSKPTNPLTNELLAGSSEGDFLTVSWEGFSFNSGEAVNKELGKIEHFLKFHDGPLVALSRSELFSDLVLTVGGKVFAIWLLKQLDKPVLWRRSRHKYTFGTWNTYRPSIFRLTRSDGCVEKWVLRVRSDRFHDEITVSGGYLGGTFTHPFRLEKHVIGISDYNGSLRLFTVPSIICKETEEQERSTYNLIKRDVERKLLIKKWQTEWNTKNAEFIKLKKEEEESKRQKLKELENEKKNRDIEEAKKQQKQQTERVILTKQDKWRLEEEERMQSIVVEKKDFDIELLKKLLVPLQKIDKANEEKERKLNDVLKSANDVFASTVQRSFPDVVEGKHTCSIDPYKDTSSPEIKVDLYDKYLEIKESSKEYIAHHQYGQKFDWLTMFKQGQ